MRVFKSRRFAKNEQSNIDESNEGDFKKLAGILLSASDESLNKLFGRGEFIEVTCHEKD